MGFWLLGLRVRLYWKKYYETQVYESLRMTWNMTLTLT